MDSGPSYWGMMWIPRRRERLYVRRISVRSKPEGRRCRPRAPFELPSYKDQEPAVAERFTRITRGPSSWTCGDLGKTFTTRGGQSMPFADVKFQLPIVASL